MSCTPDIRNLEDRVAAHQQALNEAIEKRDRTLLGATFGIVQCALAVFVFVITTNAAETWLKLLGWNEPIILIMSLAAGLATAYGVLLLVSGLIARLTDQAMQKLPNLPEWQTSVRDD